MEITDKTAIQWQLPRTLQKKKLVLLARRQDANRVVILDVKDWKSDLYSTITMHVNLVLSVYNLESKLLAESSVQFIESIGNAQLGEESNSVVITAEFRKQVKHLFNNDDVRRALE